MKKVVLATLVGMSALFAAPALAQEAIIFDYDAARAEGPDNDIDVYFGNALPMKICALKDRIDFYVWTRSFGDTRSYTLLSGECMLSLIHI